MSSDGGGCHQCGSGPTRMRFCNNDHDFITASKSFPFSGNAFTRNPNYYSSDNDDGVNQIGVLVSDDETTLLLQFKEEKAPLMMGSYSMVERKSMMEVWWFDGGSNGDH